MGGNYSVVALPQWWLEGGRLYGKAGFQQAQKRTGWKTQLPALNGRVYMVTGANSGIGYCCAKQLAALGAEVHLVCRNEERGIKAMEAIQKETDNSSIFLHLCDVSNETSAKKFASNFLEKNKVLNGLVNNAGVVMSERQLTPQGNEVCFATAMGGTFLLTSMLLPALKRASPPGRVVDVSSGGMYLAPFNADYHQKGALTGKYDGLYAYVQAKRAQVLLSKRWCEKLEGDVIFNSMHPGWAGTPGVKTSQMSWFYEKEGDKLRTEDQGADTAVWLACDDDATIVENGGGRFFFDRAPTRTHFPMAWTTNTEAEVDHLWGICEKMFNHQVSV